MRAAYDHRTIEQKWQQRWRESKMYEVHDEEERDDHEYVLVEFPYPSGNLHVGHWYAFSLPDIYVRMRRMQGKKVLFPIGFDAFGLPAENAALKHGENPKKWTEDNIEYMKKQLETMGASFDWSREVVTCRPEYYQWTQWIFLQFFKAGLVHRSETQVNWCSSCKTVLANEQVIQGKCERCGTEVSQKEMKQWSFKITDYAEKLLAGLETLDWPEEIKESQRNWIGRSEGINISYNVEGINDTVACFTTRPDTNFGATFIVVSPESDFVLKHIDSFTDSIVVRAYMDEAKKKKELERIAEGREKTGVFTGLYAVNNLSGRTMPIYVSDFVLAHVGTGAVVGVPGHDVRDFEFAQAMGIEIMRVVIAPDGDDSEITKSEQVQEESGKMVNSDFLDGMDILEAKDRMMDYLEEKRWGTRVVQYRLRDWLVSRQRYWGCPIPIIHCPKCGEVPVPEEQLPVELPEIVPKNHKRREKSTLLCLSSIQKNAARGSASPPPRTYSHPYHAPSNNTNSSCKHHSRDPYHQYQNP